MKTMTMPSANGAAPILIEKILDEELGDKCGLYARVTIPAGSILGYHEHHGNGESYYILSGRAHAANDAAVLKVYDFNSNLSEQDIVSRLFEMYDRMIPNQ